MSADWRARAMRVDRSPLLAVAFAIGLLAVPLTAASGRTTLNVGVPAIAGFVLLGLAAGWVLADRMASWGRPWWATGLLAGGIAVCAIAGATVVFAGPGPGRTGALLVGAALVGGTLVRGSGRSRPAPATLVALASTTLWITFDVARLRSDPLRDLHLYLNAGGEVLAGRSVYLDAPLTSVPPSSQLPFVYPPLTIPFFALLASMPSALIEVVWLMASVAAAMAALWLLGVRGRWLIVLIAWPPLAQGIAVGNVATFGFFLYALGFRFGPALVLSGAFKLQSALPALWLVRERRWRSIAVGLAILGCLAIVAAVITGPGAWRDWIAGLGYFQATVDRFPSMKAFSLGRWFPTAVVAILAVVAVAMAFVARGRVGLARFGLASIVASPTLYLHGFAPMLPGALSMRGEVLWLTLGLSAGIGTPWFAWLAVAITGAALLLPRAAPLGVPEDLTAAERDLHPLGAVGVIWPEGIGH